MNMGMGVVGKDLTAGTLAGIAQLIVGHPFDTVKVKLQSQLAPAPGQQPKYNGALDAVRKILATEGPRGLYRGLVAPLATVALFNAVLFTARGQMETILLHDKTPGTQLSIRQQMVAGAGAGVAVSFVACPTELVKCRLQAQNADEDQNPAAATHDQRELSGLSSLRLVPAFHTVEQPAQNFQGNITPTGTLIDIEHAYSMRTTLSVQDSADFGMRTLETQTTASGTVMAGDTSQGTSILQSQVVNTQGTEILQPQPTVSSTTNRNQVTGQTNTRAITSAPVLGSIANYRGSLDVARQVFTSEGGWTGFFKGMTPTLLREVFGNAASFAAYQGTIQLMARGGQTSQLGMGSQLLAGGVAGAMFWLFVYPADVIKSRIQVDTYPNPQYKGTIDAFRKVYAAEGVKGLYRGFGPAMARSVPANAVCFFIYDLVRKQLS